MTNILLPQADRLEKVLSYVQFLVNKRPMTTKDIAEANNSHIREVHYYLNASKQLGLTAMTEDNKHYLVIDNKIAKKRDKLETFVAEKIKETPLFLHYINAYLFDNKELTCAELAEIARKQGAKQTITTLKRRMVTVRNWSKWVIELDKNKNDYYQMDLLALV